MNMEAQSHILALSVDFDNIKSLKYTCKEATLGDIFKFKTLKSEKWRYTIASKAEGCPWYLHAVSVEDTSIFCIQSFINEHSCHGIGHLGHAQATSSFLAKK